MKSSFIIAILASLQVFVGIPAVKADETYVLKIKEHKFEPSEVIIPVGKKIRLEVVNQDATPEEFESHDLNREKIVPGNSKVTILIGPLEAGRYEFFGEFNPELAKGVIIVR